MELSATRTLNARRMLDSVRHLGQGRGPIRESIVVNAGGSSGGARVQSHFGGRANSGCRMYLVSKGQAGPVIQVTERSCCDPPESVLRNFPSLGGSQMIPRSLLPIVATTASSVRKWSPKTNIGHAAIELIRGHANAKFRGHLPINVANSVTSRS